MIGIGIGITEEMTTRAVHRGTEDRTVKDGTIEVIGEGDIKRVSSMAVAIVGVNIRRMSADSQTRSYPYPLRWETGSNRLRTT